MLGRTEPERKLEELKRSCGIHGATLVNDGAGCSRAVLTLRNVDTVLDNRTGFGLAMGFCYSTEDMSELHRTKYWHDAVCSHLIPSAAKFDDPVHFQGLLVGHALGVLTVCELTAKPHTLTRTERLIRSAPDEDFLVVFVRDGTTRMDQRGRQVVATPGSIVLLDAVSTFKHEMDDVKLLLVRIPRRQLLSRFSQAEHMTSIEIAKHSHMAPLLHDMAVEALRLQPRPGASSAQARFAAALMDTLTAAMELQATDQATIHASRYDSVYRKAVGYIDANLDNCGLDSDEIALAVHASSRTLSRVFAARGTTLMQYVWRRRLDASFALLAEGRVSLVTQAAYQCGFNDCAHFARAFKNAFGANPRTLLQRRTGRAANKES